jgi:outer membrane protein OmpA-like peptidoglycan-associated protein
MKPCPLTIGRFAAFLAVSALGAGCAATSPTPELVSAREAYADAASGTAARYEPSRLLMAKRALDEAEAVHAEEPGSYEEKHYAYVALQRAQIASTYGNLGAARADEKGAERDYALTQDRLRTSAERGLEQQRDISEQRSRELAAEKAERATLEGRLRTALESLREMAMIKEEQRGLVITLNGSVLFVTGKSELLPTARERLDQVAEALASTSDSQHFVIEGHTDSVGTDASNQKLSKDRAEAVRTYLISKGVDAERITAVGKGETTPMADNNTPEGRANNRRVEIVIGPPPSRSF